MTDPTRNALADAVNRLAAAIERANEIHIWPTVLVRKGESGEPGAVIEREL